MDLAILSGHRRVPPPGAGGGMPGEVGRNLVRRLDGRVETLPGCAQTVLEAGEAVTIVTPTGGGYGAPLLAAGEDARAPAARSAEGVRSAGDLTTA